MEWRGFRRKGVPLAWPLILLIKIWTLSKHNTIGYNNNYYHHEKENHGWVNKTMRSRIGQPMHTRRVPRLYTLINDDGVFWWLDGNGNFEWTISQLTSPVPFARTRRGAIEDALCTAWGALVGEREGLAVETRGQQWREALAHLVSRNGHKQNNSNKNTFIVLLFIRPSLLIFVRLIFQTTFHFIPLRSFDWLDARRPAAFLFRLPVINKTREQYRAPEDHQTY